MRTRLSVALNGVELDSIDPAICIQSIDEDAPNMDVSVGNRSGNNGQHLNGVYRKTMDVSIQFSIDAPKRETLRRAAILQQVTAWAASGGNLTINYRDRQKLRGACVGLPRIDGMDRWTSNYEIIFRAFQVPYWVSQDAESATISAGTSGSATLRLRESAGGKLCFEATNSSGSTVNAVTVSANGRTITFSSLGLVNGEKLIGDYDENDIQRLRILNGSTYRSVLDKRTGADDVMLNCGGNTVSVTSEAALSWNVYTYGRWI